MLTRRLSGPAITDKPILVPLTGSLYVPGKLASKDTVIVDVGTGFYVEKVSQGRPSRPVLTERVCSIEMLTKNA